MTRNLRYLLSDYTPGQAQNLWQSFAAAASMYAVEPIRMDVHDAAEIRRALEEFARQPNGALLAVPEVTITVNRKLVWR